MPPHSHGIDMINLIVIQPSSFCNINCDYCYVPDRVDKSRIDFGLLQESLDKLFSSSLLEDPITIAWHAGEPLALGIPFYEKAFSLVDKVNTKGASVQHNIQTNATLISRDWVNFFRDYNVSVGVSLDGPKILHDKHRKDWSGHGTFDAVIRGVRLMRDGGLPLGALCVATTETMRQGRELFQFYFDEGFTWLGLNIENPWGDHPSTTFGEQESMLDDQSYEQLVKTFWSELYDSWFPHRARFAIREINNMINCFKSLKSSPDFSREMLSNQPCRNITIGRDGGFTTFSPEMLSGVPGDSKIFVVGRIQDLELISQIENLPVHRKLSDEISRGVARCKNECSYFPVCGGGNPSSKYCENGTFDSTQTRDCRYATQLLADVLVSKLKRPVAAS